MEFGFRLFAGQLQPIAALAVIVCDSIIGGFSLLCMA
jgi:hypothetical protein